jgi:lysophospholipase L1-like esterase
MSSSSSSALSALITACLPSKALPPDFTFSPRLQFVCFGDSITQLGSEPRGWTTMLGNIFSRRADLFNRGYSGYNTKYALKVVEEHCQAGIFPGRRFIPNASNPSETEQMNPLGIETVITIAFGANDSSLPFSAIHLPIDEFDRNLRLILVHLYEYYNPKLTNKQTDQHLYDKPPYDFSTGSARFLLVTPPQVDPIRWFDYRLSAVPASAKQPDRSWEQAKLYSERVIQLGQQWGIDVIDQFSTTPLLSLQDDQHEKIDYLWDGLHLSWQGNLNLFQLIYQTIQTKWPQIIESQLDAPLWDQAETQLYKNNNQ